MQSYRIALQPIELPPDRHDMRPMRILVVDDHADTRQLISMYLQQVGHAVVAVSTMREALDALSTRTALELIRFVLFDAGSYGAFAAALEELMSERD